MIGNRIQQQVLTNGQNGTAHFSSQGMPGPASLIGSTMAAAAAHHQTQQFSAQQNGTHSMFSSQLNQEIDVDTVGPAEKKIRTDVDLDNSVMENFW